MLGLSEARAGTGLGAFPYVHCPERPSVPSGTESLGPLACPPQAGVSRCHRHHRHVAPQAQWQQRPLAGRDWGAPQRGSPNGRLLHRPRGCPDTHSLDAAAWPTLALSWGHVPSPAPEHPPTAGTPIPSMASLGPARCHPMGKPSPPAEESLPAPPQPHYPLLPSPSLLFFTCQTACHVLWELWGTGCVGFAVPHPPCLTCPGQPTQGPQESALC